ncbi:porin family protein [Flavobacterium procerum]|uniref:Porin family protein n=1 Tax=Flavobacterium procerum TaxID=1455569 RepID=A0ABV6BTQ7_9FLAO
MRKFIVIVFVFIGFVKSHAQVTVSPGLKGGLNISSFSNFESSDPKTDFYAGGLIAIRFNRYFTLQPEVLYSRQGAEVREYGVGGFGYRNLKYELNYVSIGAVAKYHFGGKGFHILAGPSLDIKTDDNFPDYEYNPASVDFSITAGVGYSLPNGLTFEARFKQGFIDIYNYNGLDDDYYYEDVILNNVFQIGISYTFKVK